MTNYTFLFVTVCLSGHSCTDYKYMVSRRGSRKLFQGGGGPKPKIEKKTIFLFSRISAMLSFANSRGSPDPPPP